MRFLRQPKVKDMNNTVLILTEMSYFQFDWVLVREVDAPINNPENTAMDVGVHCADSATGPGSDFFLVISCLVGLLLF